MGGYRVDKMDAEVNSGRKNWKFGKRWAWGRGGEEITGEEKIMILDGVT